MTKWNRPMRVYRGAVILCSVCGKRITGEATAIDSEYAHPVCAGLRRAGKA